jgi:hypothetical protein
LPDEKPFAILRRQSTGVRSKCVQPDKMSSMNQWDFSGLTMFTYGINWK